jgi:DNA-binding NtrC family response regulator
VRELRNLMEYLAAAVGDDVVGPWHLDEQAGGPAAPGATPAAPASAPPREALPDVAGTSEVSTTGDAPAPTRFRPIDEEIRELERRRIGEALAAAGGNQTRAAELIAMPLRTFINKLKAYGIEASRRAGASTRREGRPR